MSVQDKEAVTRVRLPQWVFDLQAAAVERASPRPESRQRENQTHAFFELYADLPFPERYARAEAYALSNETVFVFPDECLQGQAYYGYCPSGYADDERWAGFTLARAVGPRVAEELPEARALGGHHLPADQRTYIINDGMSPGHVAWTLTGRWSAASSR